MPPTTVSPSQTIPHMESDSPELFTHVKPEDAEQKPKVLYIGISSDGGLCGGIHSSITRQVKKEMAAEPGTLAVVGDKSKAQLSRAMAKDFQVSFNGVGKDVPTFAEASAIADEIIKNGGDWDEVGLDSHGCEAEWLTGRSASCPTTTSLPYLTRPAPSPSSRQMP